MIGQRLGALTIKGSTVEAVPRGDGAGYDVYLGELESTEPTLLAGRFLPYDGTRHAFNPPPFAQWAIGPDVLRALADLLEKADDMREG